MRNSPTLNMEKWILRKFCDQDLQDLHNILCDEEVNTYLPWWPSKNLDDTKHFLEHRIYAEYQKEVSYFYAIESKETHRVIGYIDVMGIDLKEKYGELGYGLHKSYWGKGIATEVTRFLLDILKEEGFAFIIATHDKLNEKSGRVLKKVGLHYQYSYHELWQPKNKMVTFRLYQINFDDQKDRVFKKYWDMYPHEIEKIAS